MATETIDIIVREHGARVVKRSLDEIGDVANRSTRGLFLLQRALYTIGASVVITGLAKMVDTIANFQNRLKLLTTSAREAAFVQEKLFDISMQTRTSFETTAQIYTRTALAAKQLGTSQEEVLEFTKSLNQATILSGASVREANAALIQMSQALASNRFSGDEFRSVAEQLPFIIDVIGEHLGVARGEVRKLGIQGKLTSQVILDSFREAREEINEKFARTIPTLNQAFTNLYTATLKIVGGFDQTFGISRSLAAMVMTLADNLYILAGAILAVGAAFVSWKITGLIGGLVSMIQRAKEFADAVKSGNAVLLTSVEIERAKAASALQSAQAQAASTAASVQELAVRRAVLIRNLETIATERTMNSFIVENGRARSVMTGMMVSQSKQQAILNALQREAIFTQRALRISTNELTAAQAAQTSAATGLAAAQIRATAANVAANTWTARLARAFPTLAMVVGTVARAFAGLWAVIIANPIGALIAAIVAIIAALVFFSDKIGVADDGLVTLRDVGIATFQLIGEAIAPLVTAISEGFGAALSWVGDKFSWLGDRIGEIWTGTLDILKKVFNQIIGQTIALVRSVGRIWAQWPDHLYNLGALAIGGLIDVTEWGINQLIKLLQSFLEWFGGLWEAVGQENPFKGALEGFLVDFEKAKPKLRTEAEDIVKIIQEEFAKSMSADYIGDTWALILERARKIAAERAFTPDEGDGGGGGGGDTGGKSFEEILKQLAEERMLLTLNNDERERMTKILKIEDDMKRSLTETERGLVEELLKEQQIMERVSELFEMPIDPIQQLHENIDMLNKMLAAGEISWERYGHAIIQANLNAADSVLGSIGQITSTLAGAFKENKALAAADVVISTAQGIMKALATQGPFGWLQAAAIGAAGAAQLAAINSAQPGSAKQAPVSGSGSTSTPVATAPATPQAPVINLTLSGGGIYSRDNIEVLFREMNAALGDGLVLNVQGSD